MLSLGSFAAKVLGALYRIPLTNLLGAAGLGLYQMVFPVYCILLDFAGAGLPCGLSKLVSENIAAGEEYKNSSLLKTALFSMLAAGLAAALFMAALSRPLAKLQGNHLAAPAYAALAPAVLFVALLSCYRGLFQGYRKMAPTAVSQIMEQLVKLVFGLALAALLMPDVPAAAAGAAFAVSLSELAALAYLFFAWRRQEKRGVFAASEKKEHWKNSFKSIVKICLPVTLVGVLLPFSQTADSFLILNILKTYTDRATALYGLFSGGVLSVIGLPVSLCYGVAVAAVPYVSGGNGGEKKPFFAVWLTLALAAAMGAACFLLPDFIVRVLFFSLSAEDKALAANLLRALSPCIVTMSLLQTVNSLLIGKGRAYAPLLGMGLGVAAKIALEIVLLPRAQMHIYGAAISLNVCYLVAVLVNLLYSIRVYGEKRSKPLPKEDCSEGARRFARKYKADHR